MGKFHYRKPRAQTFGSLRVSAVEIYDCRTINVELLRSRSNYTVYALSMKDSERLIQWVHRFDYWKRERERCERGEEEKP